VFHSGSGVLLDEPCIDAIFAIRQLTLMFSKIALPSDTRKGSRNARVVNGRRERRAMQEFVQCEQDVKDADARLDPAYMAEFVQMSSLLFGEVFSKVDRDIYWGRTIPRHGPGAVADRISSNGKYDQRTWTARLQPVLPAEEFLYPNLRYAREDEELDILEPGNEIPVRVTSVPKTLKTPRIIAMEPTCMQYAQQALQRSYRSALKEDSFLSRVIGVEDQVPNQDLAREGSLSGDLATLDMSEASDRVSNQLIQAMTQDWSHLHAAVQASRSRKADVPGHGVIRLAKFAPMGSALCFDFEAIVFLTIIFVAINRELNAPLCRDSLIKEFSRRVRVFGDDLIVPREHVLSVVDALETFGFRVNAGKSYWTGRFRESCGREYYDGFDVSIVKVRQVLPTRRQDASTVNAAVELRNLAYWAGLWQTARFLDVHLRKLLKHFPNVAPTSVLLGRQSVLGYEYSRMDRQTQSPLTKGYYLSSVSPSDRLDGVGALLKCVLQFPVTREFAIRDEPPPFEGVVLPSVNTDHLERAGRPEHVSIKLGSRSPF
jgi:hypothetical protein